MPPKGSGRYRKKAAAATEELKNGAPNSINEPGDVGEGVIEAKQILSKNDLPKEDSLKSVLSSVENGETLQNEKENQDDMNGIDDSVEDGAASKPKGVKSQVNSRGKKPAKSVKNNDVETANDNTEEVEKETLDEKVNEMLKNEEPVPAARRGRKAQSKVTEEVSLKVEESVPKKARGGRKARQQPADAAPNEEDSKAEEVSSDAMDSTSKGGRSRQQSTDIVSEMTSIDENAKTEEEPLQDKSTSRKKRGQEKVEEVNETATKKMRGGRTARQPSTDTTKEAVQQHSKVDEIPEQKEPVLESEKSVSKKVTGGRNTRKPSADIAKREETKAKSLESVSEEVEEETLPDPKKSSPKKTKSGRARHQSGDIPEEVEPESDETEKKTIELSPETKKVDPKKAKSGRLFKQAEILTFLEKKVPPARQAGKRKNAKEETKESSTEEMDVSKPCSVQLRRRQSLDDLALSNVKETETKTTGGKGSSKAAGRGKRAASEEPGVAKKAKVTKETASTSSKKEKIPDVSVLDFSNESTSPDGKAWNFKIASWNINGIRAWLEKDGMSYLQHEQPDILCIQETKCSDEKLPKEANVDGYQCYWLAGDKDGYSGVGLISKEKPLSVEYGIGVEEHDKEGRVITAEYEKFYVVATYVPNAGRGLVRLKYRMQWDTDFRAYLKKLDEKKPVILCGDLNVAHEEIDLANPKNNKKNAGFTKEERDGFSTLLSEGFVDTFRHLYPDEKNAYTFWTYMNNSRAKNVGWRLDYFVISKRFTDQLCDSVIRKDVMGSDHCPIGLFLSV